MRFSLGPVSVNHAEGFAIAGVMVEGQELPAYWVTGADADDARVKARELIGVLGAPAIVTFGFVHPAYDGPGRTAINPPRGPRPQR
jgi:hypothetical protein